MQKEMDITNASSQIVSEIKHKLQVKRPILIALDGGSGAGKSTLAVAIGQEIDSVVIPIDDFFSGHIPNWKWDTLSTQEKARDVFDWHRLRSVVLEPLLTGKAARWHPFDFTSGLRADGTYGLSPQWVEKKPASVIILEGAYSSSPFLIGLIDLSVLLDIPVSERHRRLEVRESDKEFLQRWHRLWDSVEEYYFREVRPRSTFDVVVKSKS
ncbi:MAG TPA: hypothetical protein PK414_10980 [Anaerolineales bacterium]|nr:hypothetical protein [Anaerolineales bacterium]HNC08143.1 hypothetical protein [Anaerolineales bacterium]